MTDIKDLINVKNVQPHVSQGIVKCCVITRVRVRVRVRAGIVYLYEDILFLLREC